MRRTGGLRVAILLTGAVLTATGSAVAQEIRGFGVVTSTSDLNHRQFTGLGGGVVIDAAQPWLSAGAQVDTYASGGYFIGRGTVFGQGNIVRGGLRTFLLGGVGFGPLASGPMVGAGFEIRPPNRRLGVRASVQDYLTNVDGVECARIGLSAAYCATLPHGGRPYTGHQLAVTVGVLF